MPRQKIITKDFIKVLMILLVLMSIIFGYINPQFIMPFLIGFLVGILSYVLNYHGCFYFLNNYKNLFVFFIIISFILRIIIIALVAIYFVLKVPHYAFPYIIGYTLYQLPLIVPIIKKKGA